MDNLRSCISLFWTGVVLVLFSSGCFVKPKLRFEANAVIVEANQGTLSIRPKGGEPLLGHTTRKGGKIRFVPEFPFLKGQPYEATFTNVSGQRTSYLRTLPISAPIPKLIKIFPSGSTVPANHLKFYLQFTARMEQGNIFRHFRLVDLNTNQPIEEPFRKTELWSADGKRLTLWLHPGRQKTGINLNVDLGPVLEPQGRYALEISSIWKSEQGLALAQSARKVFATKPADRTKPKPARWIVDPPAANSRKPLTITFKDPLDWALLHTMLIVLNAADEEVSGEINVVQNETQWHFTPSHSWVKGDYRIRVGWELEDLAGNNLLRLFEVNLEGDRGPALTGPRYLEFSPR